MDLCHSVFYKGVALLKLSAMKHYGGDYEHNAKFLNRGSKINE